MMILDDVAFAVEKGPLGFFFCSALRGTDMLFCTCADTAQDALGLAVDEAIERGIMASRDVQALLTPTVQRTRGRGK